MKKIHIHDDQFDGHLYAKCGRGDTVVMPDMFEASPRERRCKVCERDWFPTGQPDWHLDMAIKRQASHAV